MGLAAPYTTTITTVVAGVTLAADLTSPVAVAPFDGAVAGVEYTPTSTLTGADTNSRSINLYNRGQTGVGTTVVATKAFTNGQNAPANDGTAIPLSGTAGNLVVVQGDVLDWESLHVGSGVADPGGLVRIVIARISGT